MRELATRLWTEPETARKFLVALVGAAIIAASNGLFPNDIATWINVLGPFITAGTVYAVPNRKEDDVND